MFAMRRLFLWQRQCCAHQRTPSPSNNHYPPAPLASFWSFHFLYVRRATLRCAKEVERSRVRERQEGGVSQRVHSETQTGAPRGARSNQLARFASGSLTSLTSRFQLISVVDRDHRRSSVIQHPRLASPLRLWEAQPVQVGWFSFFSCDCSEEGLLKCIPDWERRAASYTLCFRRHVAGYYSHSTYEYLQNNDSWDPFYWNSIEYGISFLLRRHDKASRERRYCQSSPGRNGKHKAVGPVGKHVVYKRMEAASCGIHRNQAM